MAIDVRSDPYAAPGPQATRPWPLLAGIGAGLLALVLGSLELRWTVFLLLGLAVALVVLAVPDKRRLLTVTFLLSFQADVYFRLMHGRAGSAGLAFPLAFVTGAALFGWLWLTASFPRPQLRFLGGALRRPIIAMFATSALSLLTTQERFVGVTQIMFELQLWFAYFLAINVFVRREDVHRVLTLLFVVLAMQCVVYYIQTVLGITFTLTGEVIHERGVVTRPGGTVSTNPAGFASFVIPILFLVLASLLTNDETRSRRTMGLLALAGTVAIALTFTRASWSALALGMTILVVLSRRRALLSRRDLVLCICGAAIVLTAFAPMMAKRLTADPIRDSYDERAGLMRIAIRVIQQNPLTGIGDGAYGATYKSYVTSADRQWLATVHNEYLLRGAETGIPGMIAFIWLLGAAIRTANKLSRSTDRAIATLGLGWTCGMLALCWEMYWDIWRGYTYNALLWFMFGLIEVTLEAERRRAEPVRTGEAADATG